MQQLTCSVCGDVWEREPKRGRPPKVCPDCKGQPAPVAQEKPKPAPKVSPPEEKFKTPQSTSPPNPDVASLPAAGRTAGWCTDYEFGPEAQHWKCDGDLGKYRCPCSCHQWAA